MAPARRLPLALALALVLALAACGGDEETAEGGCRDVQQPESRPQETVTPPAVELDASKTYRAVVETSCGIFTITLDQEASPTTTASFVALARADFYKETTFHRIVPGFVIQGGDPTATGTGGPGYTTEDTPADDTVYTKGVVAMAKTAAEPPGTAGSQFFVVTAGDAGLPPEYAVIGEVTDGIEVVERIGLLGSDAGQPLRPVVVENVEIET